MVTVERWENGYALAQDLGWLPGQHLSAVGLGLLDLVSAATLFLGAPYVWGGRDSLGLDCSGLVQQAMFAAGLACPRDADQQASNGEAIRHEDLAAGDLVFWRGHVGMMVDAERMIHANAHHMAVAIEPLNEAITRIKSTAGPPSHLSACSGREDLIVVGKGLELENIARRVADKHGPLFALLTCEPDFRFREEADGGLSQSRDQRAPFV